MVELYFTIKAICSIIGLVIMGIGLIVSIAMMIYGYFKK